MDKYDIEIARILEKDSRVSFSSLAESVGISKTPCWQRVKQMQQKGIITGFNTKVDACKLGFEIKAMLLVVIDFSLSEAFEHAIQQHKSVIRCAAVTGEYDYVLEVLARNMSEFDYLLRKDLSRLPGVQRFHTSLSTREVKSEFWVTELL